VGASGAVFGFAGLFISDVVLNWESLEAPLVRLLIMAAIVATSFILEYTVTPLTAGVR
jgi:hypothetical protein